MTDDVLYLEDIEPGQSWRAKPIQLSEAEILEFARVYDPQPFHTDAASPEAARFGGLIASGWQVAALAMREVVGMRPFGKTPLLGSGIDELRWLKPVRPGDELQVALEITEVIPSRSKPDRGIVRGKTSVSNQNGETVLQFVSNLMIPARAKKNA